MTTQHPGEKMIALMFRHIPAPLVSFFVSWIVFFLGVFAFAILHLWFIAPVVLPVIFAAVGFFGVFSGTCCLSRTSRRVGSGALLLLGLIFYCYLANILVGLP